MFGLIPKEKIDEQDFTTLSNGEAPMPSGEEVRPKRQYKRRAKTITPEIADAPIDDAVVNEGVKSVCSIVSELAASYVTEKYAKAGVEIETAIREGQRAKATPEMISALQKSTCAVVKKYNANYYMPEIALCVCVGAWGGGIMLLVKDADKLAKKQNKINEGGKE